MAHPHKTDVQLTDESISKKRKNGLIILAVLSVIAFLLATASFGLGSQGSFIKLPGAELFIPFIILGFIAGTVTLFLTPKANIIASIIVAILLPLATMWVLANKDSVSQSQIDKNLASVRKVCEDNYTKNKDLFKVSNFTAEPVRDPQTNKITAMKVGVDIISGVEKLSSTEMTLRTEDGTIVLNAGKKLSEYVSISQNSDGSQRVTGTLPNISEKSPARQEVAAKLLPVFYVGNNIVLSDTNDSSFKNTESCTYNQNTDQYRLIYKENLSFEVKL